MLPSLNRYQSREDGFTLIELLIVVLIIGVLAAIAIPVYLGIQAQGYKSVVKADVNQSVKRAQVSVTEGAAIADVKANYADYGIKASQPKKGESVYVANSPSAGASAARDYQIVGTMDKTATPDAGPINYTYTYDSFTGKFSESDTASTSPAIVLGSGTSSLPDGYTGTSYNGQIDATVTGGLGTTQYASSTLPDGLSLNQATGAVTGTPTTAGTYPITVTVTNGSLTSSKGYTLRIYTKPVFVTTSIPAGVVGTSYSQIINVTANPTATISIPAASLPAGITFDPATNTLGGTPTTTGSTTFTATATNAGGSKTQDYTLVVNSTPAFTTTNLPDVASGASYNQTIVATGSPAPNFTLDSGTLPNGITLTGSTGVLAGTAGTPGTYNFTIKATNAGGSKTQTYTMKINGALATPAVSLSRFIGRNSVVSWNSVPNASSYQVTYSGAYTGTYTTSSTSYQQLLPISVGITNVNVSVKAVANNYPDSSNGTKTINVPGYRMYGGAGFSNCSTDANGIQINSGNCAIVSTDGTYLFVSQADGNFVEYRIDPNNINAYTPIYSSHTNGGYYISMQSDNNFVIYQNNGTAVKATNTWNGGGPAGWVEMQNDANLAIYNGNNTYLWGTLNYNGYSNNFITP